LLDTGTVNVGYTYTPYEAPRTYVNGHDAVVIYHEAINVGYAMLDGPGPDVSGGTAGGLVVV